MNQDNSVARYYAGQLQEILKLNVFPSPKDFSKILAVPGLAYIYLLEPQQKRVVIIDRTGGIIRQFQSDKFNNLLDFSVSEDGKTIIRNGELAVAMNREGIFIPGEELGNFYKK